MTGLLSLITFAPLLGVAGILLVRAVAGDEARAAGAARWIALATTLATFTLSILLVAGFDVYGNIGHQLLSPFASFGASVGFTGAATPSSDVTWVVRTQEDDSVPTVIHKVMR